MVPYRVGNKVGPLEIKKITIFSLPSSITGNNTGEKSQEQLKVGFKSGNPDSCYRDHKFCTEICVILSYMNVLSCISFLLLLYFCIFLQSACCDLTESWQVMDHEK